MNFNKFRSNLKNIDEKIIKHCGDDLTEFEYFSAMTNFYIAESNSLSIDQKKLVFDNVEQALTDGDETLQNYVATCFLENLQNVTESRIMAAEYVPFLKEESIEFCKAWDEFTGVETPGLKEL